jgi:hypothetical protein
MQSKATNYYIKSNGDDTKTGTSLTEAWKTTNPINAMSFKAGDTIFLKGGDVFSGTINLDISSQGTSVKPIVITSYGTGKAIISSGTVHGFYGYNCGGIVLSNLIFKGSGIATNTKSGIIFYNDQANVTLSYIQMKNVETSGYLEYGIYILSYANNAGYRDVNVSYCEAYDNGKCGIYSYSKNIYDHHSWVIDHCLVHHNRGLANVINTHTGSGILMSGIDSVTIQYCEAHHNGENNAHLGGGPAGIWVYNVNHALIQYCISHHNYAGKDADGDGFDFDGGTNNSIMQYNYTYNNEGAGYLIAEYIGANPWNNNIVRYNISQNDARKNHVGAISVWGGDSFSNCYIHNNTVYLDRMNMVDSLTPACVSLFNVNYRNTQIFNNVFTCTDSAYLIYAYEKAATSIIYFKNNNYHAYDSIERVHWGKADYSSVKSWLNAANTQERISSVLTAVIADPKLLCVGCGDSVSVDSLFLLKGYKVDSTSSIIDKGGKPDKNILPLARTDFFGDTVPIGNKYDIGASESIDPPPSISLLGSDTVWVQVYSPYNETGCRVIDQPGSVDITGSVKITGFVDTAHLGSYYLYYTVNDKNGSMAHTKRVVEVFDTIPPMIYLLGNDTVYVWKDSGYADAGYVAADNYSAPLTIDTSGNAIIDATTVGIFERIYKATDTSGNHSSTRRIIIVQENIISASEYIKNMEDLLLYPNPAIAKIYMDHLAQDASQIILINSLGATVRQIQKQQGQHFVEFDVSNLAAGVYYMHFKSNTRTMSRKVIVGSE